MKKLVFHSFGGNDVLELTESTIPQVGENQVLVKVAYAGINPLDWKTRNGDMRMVSGKKFPKTLGTEFSGVVTEVGNKVSRFAPGDRVAGSMGMHGGAFSEFILKSPKDLIKIPKELDLKSASVSVVCGLTAYQCLVIKGRITQNKKVLINGAAGGVGTFAVQIANILSADCWGTSSQENHAYIEKLGCQHVIDYNIEHWLDALEGFDLIFDAVSKLSFHQVKPKLNKGGIYVNTLPGPGIFFQQIYTSIFSSKKAKTYLLKFDPQDLQWLFNKMMDGKIILPEISVFPFESITDALELSETEKVKGKLIIEIDPQLA
ncbi:MAG: NAD(P)-dependent alcohol dehydrogenase [Saprospirales bacterium]|nr:MAG: NAD(P)-dependent alcohol dehydrogenase [Saprospirales bacterium]